VNKILHRVLSFDGGGIRGLYQAKLLECLKARGLDVAQAADTVAGTSTGAIVAAALAIGIQADTITEMYTDVGGKVFPPRGRVRRALKSMKSAVTWTPAYSSKVLREALEKKLGKNTKLGDCAKRLIIPAISLNQYKLKVFDSHDAGDRGVGVVDVVMASAAAPTYFLPAQIGTTYFADGGLCCNNPTFRAVSRLSREGIELSRIYVLSITTGAVPVAKAGKKFLRLHKVRWIRPIIDLAMSGSSDLAVHDGSLVGYHCRVVEGFESQIALDDYQTASTVLPPLAEHKAEEIRDDVKRWLDGPRRTGADFSGRWKTSFAWGDQSDKDKLDVAQCGDFVSGNTVPGFGTWPYTLSGTIHENVLIGEWRGAVLRGNFLLIKSRETGKVNGYWAGTGDANPYFGNWSWERDDD
jgi:hypothetical protein